MSRPGKTAKDRVLDVPELMRRTSPLPLPKPGYEPLDRPASELRSFGLPVPDDCPAGSVGYLARRAFLSRPASGVPLTFAAALSSATALPPAPTTVATAAPAYPWPARKSHNWSGAFVVPREGERLVTVAGTWTVPQVQAAGGEPASEFHSSTWIGFDGIGAYRDATLPQIGTRQVWKSVTGTEAPRAWYQWWAKGRFDPPVDLGLPVAEGDQIQAILTVMSPTVVRFNLKNVTQGIVLGAFDVAAPGDVQVSGATAEWVMERPSPMGSDGWFPYRLPAYRDFSFTGCLAESQAPQSSTLRPHTLVEAQLVRMYEIVPSPPQVRTISVPAKSPVSNQQLDFHYTGP